jgi:hypothetical protein
MKLPINLSFWANLGPNAKKSLAVLGVCIALTISFGLGRYSRPTKVEEKTHIVSDTNKNSTEKDTTTVTENKKQDTTEKKVLHVHKKKTTVETKKPDGTETKTTTEEVVADSGNQKDTHQEEQVHSDQQVDKHEEEQTHKVEDHSKITTVLQQNTEVSILGGVPSDVFSNPRVIYGVEFEKQIIGPLYGGAWLLNLGTFNDFKLAGGLKASLRFNL